MVSKGNLTSLVAAYILYAAQWRRECGADDVTCQTSGHGEDDNLHWGTVTYRVSAKCHICNQPFYKKLNCCVGWAMACMSNFGTMYPLACYICGERGTVEQVLTLEKL